MELNQSKILKDIKFKSGQTLKTKVESAMIIGPKSTAHLFVKVSDSIPENK